MFPNNSFTLSSSFNLKAFGIVSANSSTFKTSCSIIEILDNKENASLNTLREDVVKIYTPKSFFFQMEEKMRKEQNNIVNTAISSVNNCGIAYGAVYTDWTCSTIDLYLK